MTFFRLGTRPSLLARVQAGIFQTRWMHRFPTMHIHTIPIPSLADQSPDLPIHHLGGKGVFSSALHQALMDGRIDAAVHSLKDLETVLLPEIVLAAVIDEEDRRDVLLSRVSSQVIFPEGIIGTSAPRRQALIQHSHPHAHVRPIRGNIETRLKKLTQGDVDHLILASAGLIRLNYFLPSDTEGMFSFEHHEILYKKFPCHDFLPAAGQGSLGITMLHDSPFFKQVSSCTEDIPHKIARLERILLTYLEGNCSSACGMLTNIQQDSFSLVACYAAPGKELRFASTKAPLSLAKKELDFVANRLLNTQNI